MRYSHGATLTREEPPPSHTPLAWELCSSLRTVDPSASVTSSYAASARDLPVEHQESEEHQQHQVYLQQEQV